MIDIEALLQPVSEESPCGADLSYDPAYLELEQLFQGTPEREMGEERQEAQEPNWRDVRDKAIALLGRTKDLRVAMQLTVALLRLDGTTGLRDGLALLHGLLEKYWDTVHPQLDPDDGFDPLERVNIIAAISPPSGSDVSQDPMKFRNRLREATLSNSKQLGSYSYRDLLIAQGEINVEINPENPPADISVIDASFADTDTELLKGISDGIDQSREHLKGIDTVLTNRIGPSRAPDISGFSAALDEVGKSIQKYLALRGYGVAPDESAEGGGTASSLAGEITSTQDVLMALDKVCRYFELNEPSSPVPLLLRRAQRLVSKSFIEIVQDLSPNAMQQIQVISGTDNNK